MRLFFKRLFFISFLLSFSPVMAQVHSVKFNLVTGTNGVTLGKITGMVRDKRGFTWFSDQSNRCIIRYDGSHMTRYQNDPKNPNSFGGFYPECLAADSSGNIWIGFYGEGLDKFDPVANKFTHYHHDDKDPGSLHNDFVASILVDHLGNIWVGNYGGLDLLNKQTGKFKHYSHKNNDPTSLSCDTVRALYEDRAGEIWVGTGLVFDDSNPNGGLNLFHRENGTFTRYMHDPKDPHSLISNKVRAIFEDSYGNFWVGTDGDGLHTMDRKTGKFTRYTYDPAKPNQLSRTPLRGVWDHITFITEDADRKIWIGTLLNGIIRYDPVSKQVNHYGSTDDKTGVLKDSTSWWADATPDGFVWISTQNASLYKADIYNTTIPFYGTLSFNSIVFLNPDVNGNYRSTGVITSFNQDGDSILWLGTTIGLIRKDLINKTIHKYLNKPYDPNNISNVITSILSGGSGNLWIGTGNGLNYFNKASGKFTRYYPGAEKRLSDTNAIFGLTKDNHSNIWFGTYGAGIYQLNPVSNNFINYKNSADPNSISGNFITTILADGNDLWIGTDRGNGVNKMNLQTHKFTRYLSGLTIFCMYKDRAGEIWVGAKGGLYQYNKNTDAFVSISEQNPGNNIVQVEAITADKEDNLWVCAETGIYMLNKHRDQVIRFGKEYGIPEANNFIQPGSTFTGQNDEIYFGKDGGYYAFSPEKLNISGSKPKMYFTGFWLDNKPILPDSTNILTHPLDQTKTIELRHNQNVFSFSATSVDFRNASGKTIYYKLENYDVDWRTTQPEDKITYFKVPPGNYTFRIRTPNGTNNDWVEKSIAITILPPWWATWWAYCIYGILFIALVYFIHRYQKAIVIRAERERTRVKELAQAKEIEKAYHELTATQQQLIQSEKMASLGELTAGIAHEIQNPLNFVNNFSDVNKELLEELKEEADKGNLDEIKIIATDVITNEEKINHHGKRAGAIVKSMLEHSRTSSGKKEPTDINKLAEEYLRLAYHGLRAKDKAFNAEMKTDFDESIGKINIVGQDIGRVLLNLYNNAFYACAERSRSAVNQQKSENLILYDPTVWVSTKREKSRVTITVKDNGGGIPEKIKEKIFQPFFTTKPTGSGTGLGLSLSYDIVKAHGGELRVDTTEGEETVFEIQLNTNN